MRVIPSLVLSTAIGLCGCAANPGPTEQSVMSPSTTDATSTALATNPLLQTWDTPYEVPPFDKIQSQHYLPALREGIRQQKKEIDAIINTAEPPSFENTIVAMEHSGSLLMRVSKVFYAVYSANSDATIRETAKAFAPEESAHYNDILMNKALFERVAAIYEQRQSLPLNSEQQRLLEENYKLFTRSGVNLAEDKQAELKALDQRISVLSRLFEEHLLNETNRFELVVEKREDLGALPQSLVALAAAEAEKRGHSGKWVFTTQRPSIDPFLQYSPNRELRQALFNGYAMRGDNGNADDNKAIVSEMAQLRVKRARLLGYSNHAESVLENAVAATPANVMNLLDKVWPAALEAAKRERAQLQEMMRQDGLKDPLRSGDWQYYAEKVRKARYDFDENALRPYFEVNAVRDGLFYVTNQLWGISFHPREDLPKWHPDQQVFEVKEADGRSIGIVYLDLYARESKRGGAWMNDLRAQNRLNGEVRPIATTNFNFPPPTAHTPSLLSYSDAETLFHEFGHALHELFSDVTYPSLAGTALPRDFVEYPSQVMENWMGQPQVLKRFARHYISGEPIPDKLIEKVQASKTFNQGFATVEYLAASYLDMAWHTLTDTAPRDPRAFERAAMTKIGLIDEIIPRYRSTYFAHIFSSGYSSGYYGYLWSEVFDADTFAAFTESGLFSAEVAQRLRREVLSRGNSRPGTESFRAFRGRDPVIEPLLKRRGLL